MKKALQIAWPETEVGVRALFKMEPPLDSVHGPQAYVVASALDIEDSGQHTYIFAANEEGEITDWSEIDGTKGVKDIWQAIRDLGYDPVGLVDNDLSASSSFDM